MSLIFMDYIDWVGEDPLQMQETWAWMATALSFPILEKK